MRPSLPPAALGLALSALLTAGCAPAQPAGGTSTGAEGLVSVPARPSAQPRPTTPAPSTAGDLSAASLPASYLGFTAKERPPAEEEFVPNGTWVHEVAAQQAAVEALPMCPANTGALTSRPDAALMGSYLDGAGHPGNGLALSFGSTATATDYATGYQRILASCTSGATTTKQLGSGDGWYAGRRTTQGTTWTEGIGVRGTHVVLVMVQDGGRADVPAATAAARSLAGR